MIEKRRCNHLLLQSSIILMLALLACLNIDARPLTLQQARQRAYTFMQQRADSRVLTAVEMKHEVKNSSASGGLLSKESEKEQANTPANENNLLYPYYVFDRGQAEGFIIVSGDDAVAEPVLGYCDNGTFSHDELPPNMREWLDDYAAQIERIQAANINRQAVNRVQTHPKVEQLMQSQWSQGSPYNDECPMYFNLGRSVTGCVATAYAQILYYHREKMVTETQAAMPAYDTWNVHPTYGALHVEGIPAGAPIDWDNMRDTYGGSRTDAEKKAVAQLMHYCGVGVKMGYSNSSSGAQSYDVYNSLRSYFGFGNSVRYVSDASSDDEWDELVYNELAEGRPVYISGANSEGGHAFVCDGYDGNRLYHINWGWGGVSDGYYYLSNLTPGQQGIGGTGDGYNGYREIIIGIEPENYQEKTMSFADATARQLCTAAWDENGDGRLTYGEVAAVADLGTVLKGSNIRSFTELHYFKGLTGLSDDAFNGCSLLSSVQLPKQLKHIGARAFKGCGSLQALTLPENVKTLGEEAFSGCAALQAISLPQGLRQLQARMFSGCLSLKEMTLPTGLTLLADGTFEGCTGLKSFTVRTMQPESMAMGTGVFANVDLSDATLYVMQGTHAFFQNNAQWNNFGTVRELRDLSRGQFAELIEGQQVYLYHVGTGRYLTKGEAWGTQAIVGSGNPMRFKLLRSSSMPEGTYYLYSADTGKDGHYLFRTWTDTNVGNGVLATFVDGTSLTQKAHWAVEEVGQQTYTLSIPEGYEKYDANCRWGVQTDHSSNVAQPTWGVYGDVEYEGRELDCQWRFVKYDEDLVANYEAAMTLENLINVAVARGKKTQREQAVLDNLESTTEELLAAQRSLRKKLKFVDFADQNVGNICRSSFDLDADGELSEVEAVMITDLGSRFYAKTITSFDELQYFTRLAELYGNSFENCRQLTSIVLPVSIERIYYRAFMNCSKLTAVNLPEFVTLLGDNAFDGCRALTTVTVANPDPQSITLGTNVFRNVPLANATLKVPAGSKALYEQAPVWKDFGQIVEVRAKATPKFSPVSEDAVGYIYNVATRRYLSKGEAYGTQAVVGRHGLKYQWKRTANMPEGQYYLHSEQAASSTGTGTILFRTRSDSKVGEGVKACFVDGSLSASSYWQLDAIDDLTYTLQVPQGNSEHVDNEYFGTDANHASLFESPTNGIYYDVIGGSAATQWRFVSEADMEEAELTNSMANELNRLLGIANEKGLDTVNEQAVYDNLQSTLQEISDAVESLRDKLHYIRFTDQNAKTVCIEAWDDDEDNELTLEEAAAVTDLGSVFSGNARIENLDVLQYFTGLKNIPENAFRNCMSLYSIYLPANINNMGKYAFTGCSSLKYVVMLNQDQVVPIGESGISSLLTVFVPEHLLAAYEADERWSQRTLKVFTGIPTVFALPVSRMYGRTAGVLKWDVSGAPVGIGEPQLFCDELSVGTTPVGDYTIHVAPGTISTPGLVCEDGVLTVTPAKLTVTAQSYTRKQGEPNPTFEVTYKGWRNKENVEVLLRLPDVVCEATPDSPAGTYDIVVSGAEAQNYEFEYVNGVLTVEATNAIASIENGQKSDDVYDLQGRKHSNPGKKGIYVTRQKRKVVRR